MTSFDCFLSARQPKSNSVIPDAYLVPPVFAKQIRVICWVPRERLLEKRDVKEVRVVVDKLKAEHFEGEAVIKFRLRSGQLCAIAIQGFKRFSVLRTWNIKKLQITRRFQRFLTFFGKPIRHQVINLQWSFNVRAGKTIKWRLNIFEKYFCATKRIARKLRLQTEEIVNCYNSCGCLLWSFNLKQTLSPNSVFVRHWRIERHIGGATCSDSKWNRPSQGRIQPVRLGGNFSNIW